MLRPIMDDETLDTAEGSATPDTAPSKTIVLEAAHIVSTPGVLGGKPHIAGHRISVQDVAIWHERMGLSVDEIATDYELTLAEVYAALAYYFDHREEIDGRIRQGATMIEELKQRFPSRLAEHRRG
jgi:uncharacterized protein (DUF433 family)